MLPDRRSAAFFWILRLVIIDKPLAQTLSAPAALKCFADTEVKDDIIPEVLIKYPDFIIGII